MPVPIVTFVIGTGVDAITFRIKTNAPFSYSNGLSGPNRTVTYQVKGGLGPKASDALFGVGVYVFTTTGGGVYPNPHRFPNNTALTVFNVRGEPKGGWQTDPQLAAGIEFDEIQADYHVSPFDTDGTEHETVSRDGLGVPWSSLTVRAEEGEVTIPKSSFLVNGNRPPASGKTFTVPDHVLEYIYRRGMIPNLMNYEAVLDPIKGHTNSDEFFGYPADTLLMGPWDTNIQMDATGKRNQEFTMSIKYRKVGWNSLPDPDDPSSWVPVTSTGTGTPIIPSTPFAPIIEYGVLTPF